MQTVDINYNPLHLMQLMWRVKPPTSLVENADRNSSIKILMPHNSRHL